MGSIYDRWADQRPAFITHDHRRETPTPATWIAEQCQDAYQALTEAETDFLKTGQTACQALTGPALRAVVQARARWRQATRDAVQVTNRLGDLGLSPHDLELGRPAVDHLTPDTPGPVKGGSLAATPDGVLWVTHAGALVDEHERHRLDPDQFHKAGGIMLTHGDRWSIIEEALASVFMEGAMAQTWQGDPVQVCAPPSGDAIADGDPSCWRASLYFPQGIIHVKGASHHGWIQRKYLTRD